MTTQEKVAHMMSHMVALNNIDWNDLLQFAEAIVEIVKKDLGEKCSETK